ncbi:prephenate dehydrogenase [Aminirod propionatiphilus]|uniref:Prephenate dehydrogenase n=1 Tax=Aminirod propionatiphilus TaxID=3415223 RepID=A0ACD1DYP9_9BACT|nr:prephenate dehydrogenase [Synergistota bacterium]
MTGHFVDVFLPGPWWNPLTYLSPRNVQEGVRVVVPMGRGKRVGFARTSVNPPCGVDLRSLERIVDDVPPLGEELWQLALWLCGRSLCGLGATLALLSPAPLLRGEPCACPSLPERRPRAFSERLLFDVDEGRRWSSYRDEITAHAGEGLVLFPEQLSARRFWETLPESLRPEVLLWSHQAGNRRWEDWQRLRRGEVRIVVGSPSALFAPLQDLSLVIVEEEGHSSYQSLGTPFFNARSVAARRAQLAEARLVLGGSLPSARLYRSRKPPSPRPSKGKIRFVDVKNAPGAVLPGLRDPLKLSEVLIEETLAVVNAGKKALWILDRKGYAAEVACEECGSALLCRRCGTPCRLCGGLLQCPTCRERQPLPDRCPRCGGGLLQGNRPGLEALASLATAVTGEAFPVRLWHADLGQTKKRRSDLKRDLVRGGVVVGSRGALSLCDEGGVALVGWIDVDGEARRPFFDARHHAFRMIWESCWRGPDGLSRRVVLQSRCPGVGWQQGLRGGWGLFWAGELEERRSLELPPFAVLVEIDGGGQREALLAALRAGGLDPLEGDSPQAPLWLSCQRLALCREAVEPFFDIGRSRRGFPKIRVWTD